MVHDWNEDYMVRLEMLKAYGLGGIVSNIAWDDAYLMDGNKYVLLDDIISSAKEFGFHRWLYDEKGYPSGTGGGTVLKGYLEYEARGLIQMVVQGHGEGDINIHLPDKCIRFIYGFLYPISNNIVDYDSFEAVTIKYTHISSKGRKGSWTIVAFVEKIAYEGTHAQNNGFEPRRYINIMSEKAVGRFINLTYDRYAKHIPQLKDKVTTIFTDEPSLMAAYQNTDEEFQYAMVPWEDSLLDNFLEDHSYDLKPHLHCLFEGSMDEDKRVRIHFYQTVSKMVSTNYFRQINDWCLKHHIVFSGHALLEESMVYHVAYYGDLMKALREMQYPGVDMLMSNPEYYMTDKMGYFLAVKYASSAARVTGKSGVMVEICPIYGVKEGAMPTLDEMRGLANLLYLNGVNHVNSYYVIDNFSKDIFSTYSDYVGRLGLILDKAEHVPDIGIYYSIETFQGNFVPITKEIANASDNLWALHDLQLNFTRKLFENKYDFNFLDETAIIDGEIEVNRLKISGINYKVIFLLQTEIISKEVYDKLCVFKNSGGKVFWIKSLPNLLVDKHQHIGLQPKLEGFSVEDNPFERLQEILKDDFMITEHNPQKKVFVGRYKKKHRDLYMLVNTDIADRKITVTVKEADDWEVFDPYDGSKTKKCGSFETVIKGYASLFITR